MTELTHLTLAEARDGLESQALLRRPSSPRPMSTRSRRRGRSTPMCSRRPSGRSPWRRPRTRASRGARRGPLEGIPLGIKDLFCTEGVVSTAGSNILKSFEPPYESTVTRNLWRRRRGDARQAQHGRVRHGLVERDQRLRAGGLALAAQGLERQCGGESAAIEGAHLVPGGSSGGSAAAVAARLCLGATATDTGGSIRQPAAFTGTVGIKPTYGRCSRWGTVAFASSLDQAGPDRPHGAGRRDPAALHGGPRPEGHHLRRHAGAGLRGRRRRAA